MKSKRQKRMQKLKKVQGQKNAFAKRHQGKEDEKVAIENLRLAKLVELIRKDDDPILKEICSEADPKSQTSQDIAKEILDTLTATKNGAGLAAPQVGHTERIIAIRSLPGTPIILMYNPVITKLSDDKLTTPEGCLSYPGHFVDVERSTQITVEYVNALGKNKSEKYRGWKARVIQHEIDHLDGVCLVRDGIELAVSYDLAEAKAKSTPEPVTTK